MVMGGGALGPSFAGGGWQSSDNERRAERPQPLCTPRAGWALPPRGRVGCATPPRTPRPHRGRRGKARAALKMAAGGAGSARRRGTGLAREKRPAPLAVARSVAAPGNRPGAGDAFVAMARSSGSEAAAVADIAVACAGVRRARRPGGNGAAGGAEKIDPLPFLSRSPASSRGPRAASPTSLYRLSACCWLHGLRFSCCVLGYFPPFLHFVPVRNHLDSRLKRSPCERWVYGESR